MTVSLAIRDIRTTAVSVPMKRPLITSARTISTAPLLLIDLETEEGITGRAYLFCYVQSAAAAISHIMAEVASQIKGDRVAPLDISTKLNRNFRLIGVRGIVAMALAGLDVACWDALSIAADMPLATYLGSMPKPVQAYNSNGLGIMEPAAAADQAQELVEEGFGAVKLRLGRPTASADLAAVRAVRSRLPDDVKLMVDFNQALSLSEARHLCRMIDGEGVYWIEEPIRHDDYTGSAELAREIVTPIQIGENFAGPQAMAVALAANAADMMMPDLERIGGVSGWMKAAALASTSGIELSSHLFPETSAHLLAASPTAHWLEYVDWANPILQSPLKVHAGMAHIPDRPGTGVIWNDDAVAQFRLQ